MSSTSSGLSQTAIYVNIHYAGDPSLGLVLDLDSNNNLTASQYNSASLTQVWQSIPNYAAACSYGGYTLYNYSAQQCLYSQEVANTQIELGDDPTPFGADNYCWIAVTQNYTDNTTNNGVITIRDYQIANCITIQLDGSNAVTGVNLQLFAHSMPSWQQLWSMSDPLTLSTSN